MTQLRRILISALSAITLIVFLAASALWLTHTPQTSPEIEASLKKGKSFLTIEGISIRYQTAGNPSHPPIVLIHGIASSLETWKELMPALSATHYVIAFDLPGFGLSGRPETFGYTRDDFARIALDVIHRLKLGPVDLIGHSLGGGVALRIAAQAHGQVKSLTLIASTGYAFEPPFSLRFLANDWDVLHPWMGKRFVRKMLMSATANHSIINSEMIQEYLAPVHLQGRYGLAPTMKADRIEKTESEREDIKDIDVPTLVIWGEKDQWIPVKFAEQFSEDIPQADVFIEKRAGHMVHQEFPEPIHHKILSFLKSPHLSNTESELDPGAAYDSREGTEALREYAPVPSPEPHR